MAAREKIKTKICIFGDPYVGKTSLIQRFVLNTFSDNYLTTIGTKVSKKNLRLKHPSKDTEVDVAMMIWDIMGQEGFQSLLKDSYFFGAQAAIGVVDMTRRKTFEGLKKWVDTLLSVTGDIPLVIVGNKIDSEGEAEVSRDEILAAGERLGASCFFSSAKTGDNVVDMFERTGELVLEHVMSGKA